ncbi:phosphoglycolate phosphatase [Pseudodonghicola xiamenensis]|uniref:Phosphoglycolate phosphatase n=1 Tax=Pseudodonghicola xiamenensis TaxID=337702 RepID=A0A8J3H426_9RHOB|nr:phosphoglycolate phosphatase [Pseudodonghicola xiamenensis]GHG84446.1 phosphoglycolate phosphatase [Pseudodonghicola xiamenensis]
MAAIVFDLDGTLVDSAPDIQAALNDVMAEAGATPFDLASVIRFIGGGIPPLMEQAMQARDLPMAQHAALVARMVEVYGAESTERTRVFPGVIAALGQLRGQGHVLGVCTNKPEAPARHILAALGLAPYFDVLIGGDTLAVKKPDPAPLHAAFAGLGAEVSLYVGDSEFDAEAARRAGVDFLLFTEGYRKSPVEALPQRARFDAYEAFPELVETLLAAV